MADLVDSRGLFWPADHAVPAGHFAPATHVSGRLRILAGGRARLDLDAPLPGGDPHDPLRRIFRRGPVEGAIAGILSGTDQHVLVTDLLDNGRSIHFAGPSSESYVGQRCLIGPQPLRGEALKFRWIDVPMDGFEPWLGMENIAVDTGSRVLRARYVRPKTRTWRMGSGSLMLSFTLDGNAERHGVALQWREQATLSYGPRLKFDVEEAVTLASRLEDLLILLTDSNRGVDFPFLRTHRKGRPTRLYYGRGERHDREVEWDRCWVRFRQCEPIFGRLFDTWLREHEQFGPAFHLYLGNRRARTLYPEHRFASLVWGLEALHRTLHPPALNPALAKKVQRILDSIPSAKDRAWAKTQLPVTQEPSLTTRISKLVAGLPLDFDRAEIEGFAQKVNQRRNDVSHFGGMRGPGEYEAFLDDIERLNLALDPLYHALLLKQVGIPDDLLRWWFVDGSDSYWMSKRLDRAGLRLAVTTRGGHGPVAV